MATKNEIFMSDVDVRMAEMEQRFSAIIEKQKNEFYTQIEEIRRSYEIKHQALIKVYEESIKNATTTIETDEKLTQTLKSPIHVSNIPARMTSIYPTKELQLIVQGRQKRALGDQFGLQNFGINHTTLEPGASSSIQHYHTKQDEFIYILSGTATLLLDDQEIQMTTGDIMGFPAGRQVLHSMKNNSTTESVVYLEIGDRTDDDVVTYHPSVDLQVKRQDGQWKFTSRDGHPFSP